MKKRVLNREQRAIVNEITDTLDHLFGQMAIFQNEGVIDDYTFSELTADADDFREKVDTKFEEWGLTEDN